MENTLLRRLC